MTKEIMEKLRQELSNNRLDIMPLLFERFDKLGGSPDRVFEGIETQVNNILDERDEILINVFTELTEMYEDLLQSTIKTLSGEWYSNACQKAKKLSTGTR